MQWRQVQRGLPAAVRRTAHRRQQKRPARDGFHPCRRVGGTAVPTPPVVDQRAGPRRCLAALDVLRGEAAHAPLVFQLVEAVLAVRTVAVELPHGLDRHLGVRDHDCVLPQALGFVHAGASQVELELLAVCRHRTNTPHLGVRTISWTTLEVVHVFIRRPRSSGQALHQA